MNRTASLIFLSLALCACDGTGGGEYVGTWVNLRDSKYTLLIERNGENFIVRNTHPNAWDGKRETHNIPATLKGGQLLVNTDFGAATMTIDKSSGHLTDGRNEYQKSSK